MIDNWRYNSVNKLITMLKKIYLIRKSNQRNINTIIKKHWITKFVNLFNTIKVTQTNKSKNNVLKKETIKNVALLIFGSEYTLNISDYHKFKWNFWLPMLPCYLEYIYKLLLNYYLNINKNHNEGG
jgi:hypothetical protein